MKLYYLNIYLIYRVYTRLVVLITSTARENLFRVTGHCNNL